MTYPLYDVWCWQNIAFMGLVGVVAVVLFRISWTERKTAKDAERHSSV